MKWLETIGLRCAGSREKSMVMDLLRNMRALEDAPAPVGVEVYQSALLENDLSIHIRGGAETFRHGKSPLGLSLTHALRDFGLISHSVWVHEGDESQP